MTLKCSDQDDESPYFSIADKPKHILMGRKELLDFAGIEIGFYDPELNRISTLITRATISAMEKSYHQY